ncbi:MAG: AMP-binding protein, partial [Anaerolineae bacterium]|nr:AMP-binding protein [Anaerolineae bacterium]
MLTLSTRTRYTTLLDAETLRQPADRPAIIYLSVDAAPITVSRADFARSIRAYGAALRGMGIAPRDLVIIAHTQNLESIFAFWGALLIGAIPSMFPTLTEKLDPDIYMANMTELVARSGVRAVLTTDEFAPALADRIGCPVYGSNALLASLDSAADFAPVAPIARWGFVLLV